MAYEYDVVQKNIKYLMEKAGISSVTELSRKVKMQQSTLQRMLAGEIKDPKYITLKHIAEFLKFPQWTWWNATYKPTNHER
jgi:lambda repressor-like predicted transcriptional regulator